MSSLQTVQHVSEFSPDGKLFAFLNSEGKLKIWDTESSELKQEYIPNLHLSAPCTCFTWININVNRSKDKSKKARKSLDQTETSFYIALGTSKGGVALYSYATGKIESFLKGNGHISGITSICRAKNDKVVTCGEDNRVIIWSLSEGSQLQSWNIGNDKPTCLLYLPELNNLLIGSRELKLWSIDSFELKQTFTGHTSYVNLLVSLTIHSNEYVLSTSKMDRTISLWRAKSGTKYRNAVGTFLMADVAYFVSCIVDQNDGLRIAAVTRSGVVHLFIVEDVSKIITKPIKPKLTIEIASDSTQIVEPIPVITATLNYYVKNHTLLLGYGDRNFLRFELIDYDTSQKNQVLIRTNPKKLLNKSTEATKEKQLKTITPIIDSTAEYQTPTPVARRTKAIEIPMETRLENLSLNATNAPPHAKNVAQLLIQGLHNRDSNILRTVFATVDEKVIRLTLQRLPPQYVGSLINELMLLIQKKTANVQIAINWLRVLVQTHASQLLALGSDELFSMFGPLIGIIEHRANTLKQLTKLSGRLDLLTSQIQRNTEQDTLDNENVLVFDDQDTPDASDNEVDDHSSDDQWEEDDSDNDVENNVDKMDVSEGDC